MEKKQTAVQWLLEELRKPYADKYIADITNKALQMEREQIIDAAADHCYPTAQMALNDAERYYEQHYTQTFKP
mgnify:FL=1